MHITPTRLRRGALTACAAALALLSAGCSKASETTQTAGCRADDAWPGRQKAAWLRDAVSFRTVEGAAAPSARMSVVVGAPRTADARRLCLPLAVQVEFWTLTTTTTNTTAAATSRTEWSSVRRYRLFADGARTRTVGFPVTFPPSGTACVSGCS
ncbi:hypothetical protein PYK79_36730 [Streptomyces sp. ID05-04B]|uniref:hypothetical protein n=1 Tax=Streptomyces sp. ID05-04B TaxID=3028661 RepID=UPI0029C1910F|nr:hypothetical protein [Streptomyces sp. ID05-04B]MDX5567719.1 hypothetical protein [Streptomyces sp. ID05-04B]